MGLLQGIEPLGDEPPAPLVSEAPILLQFWASWCHSCAGIMYDVDELLEAHQGIQYVAVSLDDDDQDAYDYISRHALYEKYADRYYHDSDKTVSGALDIKTVPTLLLLGRNGDVLVRKSGHLNSKDKQDLRAGMKAAL